MFYLRKYLIAIKKLSVEKGKKVYLLFLGALVVSVAGGVCLDILAPFNFWVNTARMLLCLVIGASVFSLLWLLSLKYTERQRELNDQYFTMREKYSYKQRKNLAIVGFVLLAIVALLFSSPSSIYTSLYGLIIASILHLVAFIRPMRNEFIKANAGLPDVRDVAFNQTAQEKIDERKKAREEKMEKNK